MAAPLEWPADRLNLSYEKAPAAAATVGVRVFAAKDASAGSDRFAAQLFAANKLFNDSTDGAACGVRFKFVSAEAISPRYADLDPSTDCRNAEACYGGTELTRGELELAPLLDGSPSGTVNVVYLRGLGGGRGWTYLPHLLPKDAPASLKNTILLSDTASLFTLAHELGHALTGRGHIRPCSAEDAAYDPEGCAEVAKNLMLPDGRYGTSLDESQCRAMARRLKKGALDR